MRLVDHGHDVHVAYQTSGNIAVYDDEALRYADFVSQYSSEKSGRELYKKVTGLLDKKEPGDIDSAEMLHLKKTIRMAEARSSCRYCGIPDDHVNFLNMPFYETGRERKNQLKKPDYNLIREIILKIKPHQIYAAGDLSDPHGTHRLCWDAIEKVLKEFKDEDWVKDCFVWLYRGVWQDLDVSEIDMAVPLSPGERLRKRRAIFKHVSQKDQPKYPGTISGEFWMVADEKTIQHAKNYDQLGLAEYDSIEGFSKWMVKR